ncbi:AraC family transcriptional regulator [Leclercia adecarboxylata]|uniref:helix-turn-helix domain-containing protein n=1 Tax=Leclercia TaxID=83654 RepID=UPI001BDC25D2|nr:MULTISPECIES: helix-turn-helix domain-containing protein [Leclercia]MCZ7840212.1 AraC family transcriptional regulator [Leclercia adecarboxylata]QVV58683.1 AraC family transcriptional regulator [Leclercia sp. Colony189]
MSDSMLPHPAPTAKKTFSVADFKVFGERYGIDYRFPLLTDTCASSSPVLHGDVEEMILPSGISLTHSDVRVLQPYETTSRHSSPLYVLVVLEGCVTLTLSGKVYSVRPGMAFSARLSEQQAMSARHDADIALKTLSFGVYPDDARRENLLASLLAQWERLNAPTFVWQVPDFVLAGIQHARQRERSSLSRQLLLEGVMYQLLGHGLHLREQEGAARVSAAGGEHARLEQIRHLLAQAPEQEYTLAQLAAQAAMSPSSLRSKFRQAYGCTVFGYLRDCRLALARRYLLEGHSVQQAAWMSGYQHATNFATAFRRRYGICPGAVRNGC